ncbi:hypothetical protein ACTWLI_02860 [Arthrobacter sp. Hor0625]|uniref:hypothetical protein n=1 Tax=Arthrobacter sp. Hor0625 TaxID=3457358 RepID=UPI00403E3E72
MIVTALQWGTLAICALVALARIPSARRGENRPVFYILLLLIVAILLSIEEPYQAIDRFLGGVNLANVVLRFVVFAAVFFLGLQIAKGFGAEDARRFLTGKVGIGVAVLSSAVVIGFFLMMDTTGSSAGLVDVAAKSGRNRALVEYYGAAGRLYPSFVLLALLPAMVRTVRSRLPLIIRGSAVSMAVGSVATALSLGFPLIPPGFGCWRFVINYTGILCLVLGLVLIWAGRLAARRLPRPPAGGVAP